MISACRCKRVFAAAVCLLLTVSFFSGCRRKQENASSFRRNDTVAAAGGTGGVYLVKEDAMMNLGTDNGFTLLFDETAAAVAVRDETESRLWSALPTAGEFPAYSFIATVAGESGRYFLNTQDHAVAFGSYVFDTFDRGVTVIYTLSNRAEIARKSQEELAPGELQVRFTVEYRLSYGDLIVELSAGSIFVSEGYSLEKISVLPYFAALCYGVPASPAENDPAEQAVEGEAEEAAEAGASDLFSDYLLLPDGCGAVVYTKYPDPANADLTFRVSPQAGDGVRTASVGAFGIKNGSGAVLCTVTAGLSLADIRSAQITVGAARLCTAFPEFRITQTQTDGDTYLYGLPYTGTIRLVYQFLSGSRANYIAMADVCREVMIRSGLLRADVVQENAVPLAVSLLCSLDGTKNSVLSTFSQAEDLLTQLKAKGVDAVDLVLQGAYEGGCLQNTSDALKPNKKLGGEAAFNALCAYAAKQKFRLYGGVNLLYAKEEQSAKKLNGERTRVYASLGRFSSVRQEASAVTGLVAAANLEKQAVKILKYLRGSLLSGVCVNDAVSSHYYDAFAKLNQSGLSSVVNEQLSAFSGAAGLVLSGVNGEMLCAPDLILNLPLETAAPESESYAAVPFLPALLHGSVVYAGVSVNTSAVPKLAFLKCAEYGAAPHFEWVCASGSVLSYENSLADAVEYARGLNAETADLQGVRIAAHRQIRAGVYRTDYENGATVFVNYNHVSVNVGSVTIPPYDYLRMN